MEKKNIYIIGSGPYGEAMFELAELCGYNVVGYYDEYDNKQGSIIMGVKVLGKFTELENAKIINKNFIVAMGSNKNRMKFMDKVKSAGGILPRLIHPSAVISKSSVIGDGVYIQSNVSIWTKVVISEYSIISPNVVVAHHSKIGKACLISTQSSIGAYIDIKDRVFVGMGSTIVTGVDTLGENSIIGAGAVVLDNVDSNSVYVGIPAKKIKKI